MPPMVLITETLDVQCAKWLGSHARVVWHRHDQPGLRERLAQAEGLIVRTYTQVNDALLAQAPRLQVIGRAGVGLDNIDLQACRRRGIPVVFTPDANTQAVVEYVLGLMLDHVRPRWTLDQAVEPAVFHQLRKEQVGRQLDQMTLGILGFGRIGKRLGGVAHALGIKLLVNDLLEEAELRRAVDYPFTFVDQQTLYRESDIVTVHVDGRASNRHMVDASCLALMKDASLLINAARGMLVDDQALAHWAKAHPQAAAILDVHDPEPPGAENPLFDLPNVRLLPHLASRTHRALENMSWVVRDVQAVLAGRKPRYPAY